MLSDDLSHKIMDAKLLMSDIISMLDDNYTICKHCGAGSSINPLERLAKEAMIEALARLEQLDLADGMKVYRQRRSSVKALLSERDDLVYRRYHGGLTVAEDSRLNFIWQQLDGWSTEL